ncbi:hypothetical protein F442_12210 [Phytophthora nicotianae P10297]|uniref:Uncharacterized protein n=4 Tax=Phytophthora nicotianae TaxID=4792 RepID=V9ETN8_PHYNI|nr:hypothetical protein F443_12296 [Phytophthora nicotianae P1569]ETM42532.1 hypothetical protein L914_11849 [Phytophthora nicotianae]ETO71224.1 hypothetical protein F444_12394 [Phytophthora nicotianae P1976]ETP40449.1 hypothetical protein F442_12210 [Phytophthora nicotianae P10297]
MCNASPSKAIEWPLPQPERGSRRPRAMRRRLKALAPRYPGASARCADCHRYQWFARRNGQQKLGAVSSRLSQRGSVSAMWQACPTSPLASATATHVRSAVGTAERILFGPGEGATHQVNM